MDEMVGGRTGFVQCGILSLCKTDADMRKAREFEEEAKLWQLDTKILLPEELPQYVPGLAGEWKGAMFTASDGRAEPALAVPAIARGVQMLGGTVLTNCAVRGIETRDGRVSGVITERGRIAAARVVLAGGVWSSLMLRQLGIRLPQLKVLGNVMRTAPLAGGAEISIKGPGFGMRKREDGGYNIAFGQSNEAQIVIDSFRYFFDFLPRYLKEWRSLRLRFGKRFFEEIRLGGRWRMDEKSPFEKVRILDPEPLRFDLDKAGASIRKVLPLFNTSVTVERWAGLIDVTPDAVPVISNVDALPGLTLSTGYSGHGFGLGPGAGRLTAEIVLGKTPCVDPAPFDFRRLSRTGRQRLRTDK
jgi:glycine/D-amino acid oxidase-like deaminating enzyme